MARPRRGEKGSVEAGNRWRQTMLAKHGGEDGLHRFMQSVGKKGGSVVGKKGGFASDVVGADGLTGRERARKVGVIGGRKSRRTKKDPIDTAEQILTEESKHDRD